MRQMWELYYMRNLKERFELYNKVHNQPFQEKDGKINKKIVGDK